ncbi:GLRA3 [Cordylochernes scorpioides]|uniref:GLRA3 n=1 Tax=Cordylochernes scorpioides TaxID=51811 RepID=A0ABY6LLL4_9ARAC|nr:GLRA3 [Cordylochernes scorpioides]
MGFRSGDRVGQFIRAISWFLRKVSTTPAICGIVIFIRDDAQFELVPLIFEKFRMSSGVTVKLQQELWALVRFLEAPDGFSSGNLLDVRVRRSLAWNAVASQDFRLMELLERAIVSPMAYSLVLGSIQHRHYSYDYSLHMYFDDTWKDRRLKLGCFRATRPVVLPDTLTARLWMPDVYFENTKAGDLFKLSVPNSVVKILPDHSLYRSSRSYKLYMERLQRQQEYKPRPSFLTELSHNYSYPDDQVRVQFIDGHRTPMKGIPAVQIIHQPKLPQFQLVKVRTDSHTDLWESGNFTMLTVYFEFDRELGSYLVNTYVPSGMVVILSWLSFWLDVNAVPARVTLGVTSLLTVATQMVNARKNLPPVAYTNALDMWLFMCLNSVFLSIVEYGLSYYVCHYSTFSFRLPLQALKNFIRKLRNRHPQKKDIEK